MDDVRRLVTAVLAAHGFEGDEALLRQVPALSIVGGPVTMIELAVDRSLVERSTFGSGPTPGNSKVLTPEGEPVGSLLVWIEDGYISCLEYGWVTDETPTELPPPTWVRTDIK